MARSFRAQFFIIRVLLSHRLVFFNIDNAFRLSFLKYVGFYVDKLHILCFIGSCCRVYKFYGNIYCIISIIEIYGY